MGFNISVFLLLITMSGLSIALNPLDLTPDQVISTDTMELRVRYPTCIALAKLPNGKPYTNKYLVFNATSVNLIKSPGPNVEIIESYDAAVMRDSIVGGVTKEFYTKKFNNARTTEVEAVRIETSLPNGANLTLLIEHHRETGQLTYGTNLVTTGPASFKYNAFVSGWPNNQTHRVQFRLDGYMATDGELVTPTVELLDWNTNARYILATWKDEEFSASVRVDAWMLADGVVANLTTFPNPITSPTPELIINEPDSMPRLIGARWGWVLAEFESEAVWDPQLLVSLFSGSPSVPQSNKSNAVPIAAGVTSGFIILIVAGTLTVLWKKKVFNRETRYSTTKQPQPQTQIPVRL